MDHSSKIIDADDKSVKDVLDKVKYSIDVFQREYKWEKKHMEQLIVDLTSKFLTNYKESDERTDVGKYGKYYLGSIVLCDKDGKRSIIDGQQRLTSLTLLLIYLNNLQKERKDKVKIDELIFSEKFAQKSFNLNVEDRKSCIQALYEFGKFDATNKGESVKNITERYLDIEEIFPNEIKEEAISEDEEFAEIKEKNQRILPFFIDWLVENVIFVEIITFSDEEAYTIFETTNDRGLNLTSSEMLKGYLISNLGTYEEKIKLNELWKDRIFDLKEIAKEGDLEFFKAWLRSKYAETIRQGKKGSANEDFEKIGTRFHSWVRDNKEKLGLKQGANYSQFIENYFQFYVNLYIKISDASRNFAKELESIFYIEKKVLQELSISRF